jgi:hypothetical protein
MLARLIQIAINEAKMNLRKDRRFSYESIEQVQQHSAAQIQGPYIRALAASALFRIEPQYFAQFKNSILPPVDPA